MVPKKVGDDLRRRRITLRMKQSDIGRQIGTTRAYVSAVERGVDWDPDADKLVNWARALGLEDDAILRQLGRVGVPANRRTLLEPEVVDAITQVVAAGIRDGFQELLARLDADATPPPAENKPRSSRRERPA